MDIQIQIYSLSNELNSTNKIQGTYFLPQEIQKNKISLEAKNHSISDQEYDDLQEFIDLNSDNSPASVICFKIINTLSFQKNLGFVWF